MTGHTLTLLVANNPVLSSGANKRDLEIFKRFIMVNRMRLEFTEDNMITFPWLRDIVNTPAPTAAQYKMTKLEKFVWDNPHVDFAVLASQTNRTVSSIERAYDRAKKKNAAQIV